MTNLDGLNLPGLIHRGKVRDTYDLGNGLLLMVATDRISAFDVVLPTTIPDKGLVLANLSAFWFHRTAHISPNHFIAMAGGSNIPDSLTNHPLLTTLPAQVAGRAMVVHQAQRIDVECVIRGYITGSAWSEYKRSGTINGESMPSGLQEGDRFPEPLFTPTTKAEEGHDEPLTLQELRQQVGVDLAQQLQEKTLEIYLAAHDYALAQDIIIADTKLEFGFLGDQLIIIDELLTPDSSRFWDAIAHQPGRSQPNFDKQFVRDWLDQNGWDREPPAPELPPDVVERTKQRYRDAYRLLTGSILEEP